MAQKLTALGGYLTSFVTGQGASPYHDYPQDLDTNFLLIQAAVNQLVDEVSAARLADGLIPTDLLARRDVDTTTIGARYRHDDLAVTRSSNTINITAGEAFIKGQRIAVASPAAINFTGLSNGTYRIPIDRAGVILPPTTTANSAHFDLVTVIWDGSMTDADVTDHLFNGGRTLVGTDSGFLQGQHTPPNEIASILDVNFPGRLNPSIRYLGSNGTLGDAGFTAGPGTNANAFHWISRRATSPGVGNTVLAAQYTALGQLQLLEQARVTALRTTTQAIATGAAFTAITFDAPVANAAAQRTWRREPQAYFADPWISAAGATLTVPGDSALSGTYLATFTVDFDTSVGAVVFCEARLRATSGTATDFALVRVGAEATTTVLCGSGMMDLAAGDSIQLQVRHGAAGSVDVRSARVSLLLVGGGV